MPGGINTSPSPSIMSRIGNAAPGMLNAAAQQFGNPQMRGAAQGAGALLRKKPMGANPHPMGGPVPLGSSPPNPMGQSNPMGMGQSPQMPFVQGPASLLHMQGMPGQGMVGPSMTMPGMSGSPMDTGNMNTGGLWNKYQGMRPQMMG